MKHGNFRDVFITTGFIQPYSVDVQGKYGMKSIDTTEQDEGMAKEYVRSLGFEPLRAYRKEKDMCLSKR